MIRFQLIVTLNVIRDWMSVINNDGLHALEDGLKTDGRFTDSILSLKHIVVDHRRMLAINSTRS